MTSTFRLTCALISIGFLSALSSPAASIAQDRLPGTQPWRLKQPLDEAMVDGLSQYAEAVLAEAPAERMAKWPNENSSSDEKQKYRDATRKQLIASLGIQPESPPSSTWLTTQLATISSPSQLKPITVSLVTWRVDETINARATVWKSESPVKGNLLIVPDGNVDLSYKAIIEGSSDSALHIQQRIVQLASAGYQVYLFDLIDRGTEFSGDPRVAFTDQPHREFIYRIGFELGRHLLGLEVNRVRAWVSSLEEDLVSQQQAELPIVVWGIGDGGLVSLMSAVLDSRIDTVGISGYFGSHTRIWEEPLDRNIWRQQSHFGNAELGALLNDNQRLLLEKVKAGTYQSPTKPPQQGIRATTPPAVISGVPFGFDEESLRLNELRKRLGLNSATLTVPSTKESESAFPLLRESLLSLSVDDKVQNQNTNLQPLEREKLTPILAERQQNFRELVNALTLDLHDTDRQRDLLWKDVDRSSLPNAEKSLEHYRTMVNEELIGTMPVPTRNLQVFSRKLSETPDRTAYEIEIPLYDTAGAESVFAGGILLLPKSIKEGEKRPVVVCQHGLEGVPMDTITEDPKDSGFAPYQGFASKLAALGYIVYSPQNPYRGRNRFRVIQRKSNPVGRTLFSYIVPQHQQTLRWLATLPNVDPSRIAFYGLSYGGKTAMRVPPLLPPTDSDPGYCLSICSADFNEWVRKNASSHERFSYVFTIEYEIFEWNMGRLANYAELGYLMTPRPFMVERGHDDGVAPDEWVAWEYAKIKRHYDKVGIGDRTELEVFNGPHMIHGVGTFEFLKRHLNYPN